MEVVRLAACFVLAALSANAADFSLGIGGPSAAMAPGNSTNAFIKKSEKFGAAMAVRAENCADPSKVQFSGTAEGILDGARRSIPLRLTAGTVPGAYIVSRDWPQGFWVVSVTGTCGAAKASAIVPFGPDGNFIREASKFYPRPSTSAEIEASLKTLAGGKK